MKLLLMIILLGAVCLVGLAIIAYYAVLLFLAVVGSVLFIIGVLSMVVGEQVHPLAGVVTFVVLTGLAIFLARPLFSDDESDSHPGHLPPR